MATCSNTKDKLTAKATTLQTNSDAVTAAVAKMNSLAGTSRRNIRAAAASCAEVITKSTSLTVIISQSTSSSQISVIATEISTSSVTCTDPEKASLSSQISSGEDNRGSGGCTRTVDNSDWKHCKFRIHLCHSVHLRSIPQERQDPEESPEEVTAR